MSLNVSDQFGNGCVALRPFFANCLQDDGVEITARQPVIVSWTNCGEAICLCLYSTTIAIHNVSIRDLRAELRLVLATLGYGDSEKPTPEQIFVYAVIVVYV